MKYRVSKVQVSGQFARRVYPNRAFHKAPNGKEGRSYVLQLPHEITDGGKSAVSLADALDAMGICHPMNRAEVSESIPPAYSECVGKQVMASLSVESEGVRAPLEGPPEPVEGRVRALSLEADTQVRLRETPTTGAEAVGQRSYERLSEAE